MVAAWLMKYDSKSKRREVYPQEAKMLAGRL